MSAKHHRSFKAFCRLIVVATSRGPLRSCYLCVYSIVIAAAKRVLRRMPIISALYLRRGCAKKEIIPGLSDIDFAVIVNLSDRAQRIDLLRRYKRFARLSVLADPWLNIHDGQKFGQRDLSAAQRYYFQEGKETWKLLYGFDYLTLLPGVSLERLYGGLYLQFIYWWRTFSGKLLRSNQYRDDWVLRNSLCHKIVCEVLGVDLALQRGFLTFSRQGIFQRARAYLTEAEQQLADQILATAETRFLVRDDRILGQTTDFLLSYLDRVHGALRSHPHVTFRKDIALRVDFTARESNLSEEDQPHLESILLLVRETWRNTFVASYLVSSWSFAVGDPVLLLKVDPQHIPTAEQLVELCLLHEGCTQRNISKRLHINLLLRHSAFQVGGGILSPLRNPDLYCLLQRSESAAMGENLHPCTGPPLTSLVEEGLRDARIDICDRLAGPHGYLGHRTRFLQDLWKVMQLLVIQRSLQQHEPLLALTVPAVRRAMERHGIRPPRDLEILADAYAAARLGEDYDISAVYDEALIYLLEAVESLREDESVLSL